MKLWQAFEITRGEVVAFVGAGGKTSLLVGLGYELAEAGWRVLATTSTSLRRDQLSLFPRAMPYDADARHISEALSDDGLVLLYDEVRNGLVSGPAEEWTRRLLDSVDSDVLLIEADEADGLPFKAPLPSQPRIPPETSLVVPVASLDALGVPLDDEHVYNPAAMIDRFGFVENSPVKSPWLAQVLRDEQLGLKDVPPGARVVIFINRTPERGYLRGRARMIARLSLQSPRVHAVALGSVRAAEPVHELQRTVGAVVLAAENTADADNGSSGSARRGGKNALTRVCEQLIRSRVFPMRVVAGVNINAVRTLLQPLDLTIVRCRRENVSRQAPFAAHSGAGSLNGNAGKGVPPHLDGQSLLALQAGLHSLPDHVAATLIVPGDHSPLHPKTIFQLLTAYARGLGDLLIPLKDSIPGMPVLLGRRYWSEICAMPGQCRLSEFLDNHVDDISFVDIRSVPSQSASESRRRARHFLPRSGANDQSD